MGAYLAEHIDAEDLATTLKVLEEVGRMPLDPLSARIETDGHGNPLYTYGNRMVWSKAQDIAETASHARDVLSRAYLEHEATKESR